MISFLGPNIKKLKREKDVKGLADLLAHRKAAIRNKASAAIAEFGEEGLPVLFAILSAPFAAPNLFPGAGADPAEILKALKKNEKEKKKIEAENQRKKLKREMAIATLHKMDASCLPAISARYAETGSAALLDFLESKGWVPESQKEQTAYFRQKGDVEKFLKGANKKEKIEYFRQKGDIGELVKIADDPERELKSSLMTNKSVSTCLRLLAERKTKDAITTIVEYFKSGARAHHQRLAALEAFHKMKGSDGYLVHLKNLLTLTADVVRKYESRVEAQKKKAYEETLRARRSAPRRATGEAEKKKEYEEILCILKDYLLEVKGSSLKKITDDLIPLLADLKLRETALISLSRIGTPKATDAILQYIYRKRFGLKFDAQTMKHFQSRFKDYTELIFGACHIPVRCTDAKKGHNADLEFNLGATEYYVEKLCAINSPVSSNLLNLISAAKDPEVDTSGEVEVLSRHGGGQYWSNAAGRRLSLESIRSMAAAELKKRVNPPYDPGHYAKKSSFIIA